jgi:hypothetical protein
MRQPSGPVLDAASHSCQGGRTRSTVPHHVGRRRIASAEKRQWHDLHRHIRVPGMNRAQLFLIESVVLILLFGVGCVFVPHLRRVLASLNR